MEFADAEPELYAFPLAAAIEPAGQTRQLPTRALIAVAIDSGDTRWIVRDGMMNEEFARELLKCDAARAPAGGPDFPHGRPARSRSGPMAELATLVPQLPEQEQSNSNVVFGEQVILKLYRRISDGINPEVEIGQHLTRVGFPNTAALAGVDGDSRRRLRARSRWC